MHRINLYQTLLTEGQWSYINEVFFENDCRKRKNSLRSLFEAVLYLLVTGCQGSVSLSVSEASSLKPVDLR